LNKLGIWGIVIAGAFFVGVLSANPVVEAAGGWKAAVIELSGDISDIELFLEERSDFWEFLEEGGEEAFESQVYEVSGVSVIPANEVFGNEVQLRCLDGDVYLTADPITLRPQPPPSDEFTSVINAQLTTINESGPGTMIFLSRAIGMDVIAFNQGSLQLFPIAVTVVGLCLSPSS